VIKLMCLLVFDELVFLMEKIERPRFKTCGMFHIVSLYRIFKVVIDMRVFSYYDIVSNNIELIVFFCSIAKLGNERERERGTCIFSLYCERND
jgi:hypothetical protein